MYPLYVAKAKRKGRTKQEVDEIIRWLTGYGQKELEAQIRKQKDFETFFAEALRLNPSRGLIKGAICGVRVEDVAEPLMREIRYLDKLIDELAKGKAMEKILRNQGGSSFVNAGPSPSGQGPGNQKSLRSCSQALRPISTVESYGAIPRAVSAAQKRGLRSRIFLTRLCRFEG